jgi:KTSC domain-containing protein
MPSTAITDIQYKPSSQRVVVTFITGRVYEYFDVPEHVASAFRSAISKRTYFNVYIRDRYDYRELTREQT